MVRPGNGTPWKVAELSCWKVARLLGCTVCSTRMKEESGTMSLLVVRTWYLSICSAVPRWSRGTCGITW